MCVYFCEEVCVYLVGYVVFVIVEYLKEYKDEGYNV